MGSIESEQEELALGSAGNGDLAPEDALESAAGTRRAWLRPADGQPAPGGGSNRAARFLAPTVAFPALWALGVAVAQIHLVRQQTNWSARAWLVMLVVPVAFVVGGRLAERAVDARVKPRSRPTLTPFPSTRLRVVLAGLILVGYLELVHQFIAGGGVPLLSSNIDASRFRAPGGPTVILINLLTVAGVIALGLHRNPLAKRARFELAIALLALGGFGLAASRGGIVQLLGAAMLFRILYWGLPSLRAALLGGGVIVGSVVLLFFLRLSQHAGSGFTTEVYDKVLPSTPLPLRPLIPIHLGLAPNFQALAAITDYFPGKAAYAHGAYDAKGLDLFIPGALDLGNISQQLAGWATATVAGPLWADGGMPLVVLGLALTGALTSGVFRFAQRTRELRHLVVAGFLLYVALFGVYVNLWTQHVDWMMIAPLLFAVGWIAQDPLGARPLPRLLSTVIAGPDRAVGSLTATYRRRRPLMLAAGALVLLLVVAAAGAKLLKPGTASLTRPIGSGETWRFPARGAPPGSAIPLSDGNGRQDNEPLWTAQPSGHQTLLRVFRFDRPFRLSESSRRLALDLTGGKIGLDVASWTRGGPTNLFTMVQNPGTISVKSRVLSDPVGPPIERGVAPTPAPPTWVTRDLALATYSGKKPDLFVIDRRGRRNRVALAIYSGESGFRKRLLDVRLPIAGLSPRDWSVDVAFVDVPRGRIDRPDLILVKRNGPSSHAEMHVLSGQFGYQIFSMHSVLPIASGLPHSYKVLPGTSVGTPTAYAVDLRNRRHAHLTLIPLAPRPPGATTGLGGPVRPGG